MGLLGGTATDRPAVFTQEDERLILDFHKLLGRIPAINQGVYHVSRQIGLIMAAQAFDRSGWRNRNENSVLDIDDALKIGSEKLDRIIDKKKANELSRLENKQAVYIRPFLDNLALVDKIYNEPVQIMFDDDFLYCPEVG